MSLGGDPSSPPRWQNLGWGPRGGCNPILPPAEGKGQVWGIAFRTAYSHKNLMAV
jgi:hypothetical protein